jgi:ADP-ribosylglycohydrolase
MRHASGCLFGLAFGDALGAKTEFLSVEEIIRRFPPQGPEELEGNPALVTDDTQMTLAVGEALVAAAYGEYTATTLEPSLRKAFVDWCNSPDNNRAPGMTCLSACENLETGIPWHKATIAESKGCGANMRVAPVGLLRVETQGAIAQFQAALTHGHPTALAASDLTAQAIQFLLKGGKTKELPAQLRNYAHQQRTVYHHDWLGNLWERPYTKTPEEFISRGWDECLGILDRLDSALINPDYYTDPCLATGAGWIAEEALGTGLLCFLLYPEEPVKALQRAAVTSGDSDSIACLTGAFAGAYLGMSVWSDDWVSRIEYRERLENLGKFWD